MSNLVVYIVPGTWQYGFFRRKSKPGHPMWFEQGGGFYDSVLEPLPKGTQIRRLIWSGQNRFGARSAAAQRLAGIIVQKSEEDPPDTVYAIVAHSHGGTIAADAVSMISGDPVTGRIAGLITLATPFASSSPAGTIQGWVFAAAVGAFFAALIALAGIWMGPEWLISNRLLILPLPFAAVVVTLLHPVMHALMGGDASDYAAGKRLPDDFHVMVLRAPQDEASLVLSFVQTLRKAARAIYSIVDLPAISGSFFLLVAGAVTAIFLQRGVRWLLMSWAEFPSEAASMLTFPLAAGIPAAILVLAEVLSALSVGHWRPWLWWARNIDVEAAPLNHYNCSIVVLSNESDDHLPGLRHSLHEREDVRAFVKFFLNGLIDDGSSSHDASVVEQGASHE
ncbi:hypothetical protein [Lysobacter sp. Root916]|uniref:hypothetical protein n=1 Tax=Lysobacter sp. Root916 TaxID=1736606 RepID=UPI000B0E20F0|nr:hypothetical protein [Lysobacter sp. Root916]